MPPTQAHSSPPVSLGRRLMYTLLSAEHGSFVNCTCRCSNNCAYDFICTHILHFPVVASTYSFTHTTGFSAVFPSNNIYAIPSLKPYLCSHLPCSLLNHFHDVPLCLPDADMPDVGTPPRGSEPQSSPELDGQGKAIDRGTSVASSINGTQSKCSLNTEII